MAEPQKINEHEVIEKIKQLLVDEGLDPQVVSYHDVSVGVNRMLRGLGIETYLDITNTIDRSWPSKREETDSPW
ncbi:hypothetical protein [Glycomyces buryatensis]|uniref:Uncharacterized protein n=1 Tax=Glycomyces buryatensis TaxID=2570927 RepID=A0A4S8QAR2_9ACTN|nr:hypothetical protein [Glycomyces buryatensis]THV40591.1 hypothetical protein FAB82_15105 [Glycomyces buryatensis]